MLEQEIASIIKFTLDHSGNPAPYYYDIPQSFRVPAMYFPTPEITTRGETFRAYAMDYAWYIKCFHRTVEGAYELALKAVVAFKESRNIIPLIGEDGKPMGRGLRIDDPAIKTLDDGAIQLTLNWTSRRPYNKPVGTKMQDYVVSGWEKPDLYTLRAINQSMESALETFLNDYAPQY